MSDASKAFVTSANLTAGGIYNNFEYGIIVNEVNFVSLIKNDVLGYGNLGAQIASEQIDLYCRISAEIEGLFRQKEASTSKQIERRFNEAVRKANDELVRARIHEGSLHHVFEKTTRYLLQKNGPLSTVAIHTMIEGIHPDLCDNTIDRVINGVRFGKKWKHAVRTAQQNLKKKGIIELKDGDWQLV